VVPGGSQTVLSAAKTPGHTAMADHVTVTHRVAREVLHVVNNAGQIIVGQHIIHRAGTPAQAGGGSQKSSQPRGSGVRAATIPPTMAQVVSMSPPAAAVVQKAFS